MEVESKKCVQRRAQAVGSTSSPRVAKRDLKSRSPHDARRRGTCKPSWRGCSTRTASAPSEFSSSTEAARARPLSSTRTRFPAPPRRTRSVDQTRTTKGPYAFALRSFSHTQNHLRDAEVIRFCSTLFAVCRLCDGER